MPHSKPFAPTYRRALPDPGELLRAARCAGDALAIASANRVVDLAARQQGVQRHVPAFGRSPHAA